MNIETLKSEIEMIENEIKKVDALLSDYERILDYKLVVKKGNGYFQYWYRDSDNKLIYIPSMEHEFATQY